MAHNLRHKSQQCGTHFANNGDILYISYDTIIGFRRAGDVTEYDTAEKFSPTTSKQQKKLCVGCVTLPAEEFRALVRAAGWNPDRNQAPTGF